MTGVQTCALPILRFPELSFVLVLILFFAYPAHAAGIVVLHSESGPTPWTQKLVEGLTSELGGGVLVRQEYLGGENGNEDHYDAEYERLALVPASTTPIAVITSGKTAFAFMRKYRDDLFTGAPVLFCSMPRPEPGMLSQCGDCSGIPLEPDVRNTVDLIFDLRPDTRLVVGIMDSTPASQLLRKKMEAAMEPYMDRAQFIFPGHEPGDDTGLNMKTLATVASSVPISGAVLFLGFHEDKTGKPVNEEQAVRLLSERSAAPVFVLTDTWVGKGVLGGLVATGEAQGRALARLVSRIQAGEPPQEMLPQPTLPQLVADATVLARFGIDARQVLLLSGALIVNEPAHPDEQGDIRPSGILTAVLGLIFFVGLLYLLRRLTSRKYTKPEQRP